MSSWKAKSLALSLLGLLSISPCSQALPAKYVLVAPACLTANLSVNHKTLATVDKFTLLEVDRQGLDQLIAAKLHQKTTCGGFFNVTDDANFKNTTAKIFLKNYLTPHTQAGTHKAAYAINYPTQVNQLISLLNTDNMWSNLTSLSGFNDRYSDSDNGTAAAKWIQDQITQMVKSSGRTDISIRTVEAGPHYKQGSLIVKIGNSNDAGIVVGGHMDTLNGYMPGADDDGSGSVTVLEVAKALISSNMQFKKPIYLIWYSAEEEGLIGSTWTVRDFILQKIPVDAVIQFDMTGYSYKNDPTMWLMQDYTDNGLTAYLETLINNYVKVPVKYTSCGYACSDHAAWDRQGYKASFAFEAEMGLDNPYIHTSGDTMEKISINHINDFAKLGVAFAVELAEPASA